MGYILLHHSTHRLTQTISQHTFCLPRNQGDFLWHPSQYLELQFPEDLDLIGGKTTLNDEKRRVSMTPCRPRPRWLSRSELDEDHEEEQENEMVVLLTPSGG